MPLLGAYTVTPHTLNGSNSGCIRCVPVYSQLQHTIVHVLPACGHRSPQSASAACWQLPLEALHWRLHVLRAGAYRCCSCWQISRAARRAVWPHPHPTPSEPCGQAVCLPPFRSPGVLPDLPNWSVTCLHSLPACLPACLPWCYPALPPLHYACAATLLHTLLRTLCVGASASN
jgi:hypothetical protein